MELKYVLYAVSPIKPVVVQALQCTGFLPVCYSFTANLCPSVIPQILQNATSLEEILCLLHAGFQG